MLTFVHECLPQSAAPNGCPIPEREVNIPFSEGQSRLNEYVVPDVRCRHTNSKLKLIAIDGQPVQ